MASSELIHFAQKSRKSELAAAQLMNSLSHSMVEKIRAAFRVENDAVSLPGFIKIMKESLPPSLQPDTLDKVEVLVDIFAEIDINGDASMEWEELTRYMVEKASLFKDRDPLEGIPPYAHNPALQVSSDGHRTRDSIDCIIPIPRNRQFACTENHSPIVSVYDSRTLELAATLQCPSVPLSLVYVEEMQAVIASCSDTTMVRFNVGESAHKQVLFFLMIDSCPVP